jgi:hypothetical protein
MYEYDRDWSSSHIVTFLPMYYYYRNEADLGRFSEGIYKKLSADAKKQRFQGFRPGTIPPHLEPTYRGFAMDECARETVLEAMQQNNVRPFTNTRTDLFIGNVSIPPPSKKATKKKKGGRKKKTTEPEESSVVAEEVPVVVEEVPTWLIFETMKEAILPILIIHPFPTFVAGTEL